MDHRLMILLAVVALLLLAFGRISPIRAIAAGGLVGVALKILAPTMLAFFS